MEIPQVLDTYSAAMGASIAIFAVFCGFLSCGLGKILLFLIDLLIRKFTKRTVGK